MSSRPTIDADLCVVGAGIVGMAHAHEARARGLKTVVVERNDRAVGASVRNFGHGFMAAMADGEALECALHARERWISLGRRAGLDVTEAGSLVVARHDDELEVMAAVAANPLRGARIVTPAEIAELAPIPTAELKGGLYAARDIRVDPRRAVAGLAALFEADDQAQIVWGSPAYEVTTGRVESERATVRAPAIVVCPGPDYDLLGSELRPHRAGLTRCKLQMLRVKAPDNRRYRPALLTGLSLLRYPAFTDQPGCDAVKARIESEHPELTAAGIHLIVAQQPDGELIIGDTHEYGDAVSPFGNERLDDRVLQIAAQLLGADSLQLTQRWHGVYPVAPGNPFMVEQPLPGVALVEVVSGVGMTTALGLAPRALDVLLGSLSSPAANRRSMPREAPHQTAPARAGYGS